MGRHFITVEEGLRYGDRATQVIGQFIDASN